MPKAFHSYEMLTRIGVGGMAEVFKALAFSKGGKDVLVCVKRILPQHAECDEFRDMFVSEARVAATLRHPNVVRMLDLGRIDHHLFIAMEFIDGGDLATVVRLLRDAGTPIGIDDALYIAIEVLKGLHYAHTRSHPDGTSLRIVHRDISPGNVMVSRLGLVKVSDFGLAKTRFRSVQTVPGVVKGNTRYIAPEQVSGEKLDARTDVYQVGILLTWLLSGKHPLEGLSVGRALDRTIRGEIPLPSYLEPSVPVELDVVVAQAIARLPVDRYGSALHFQQTLEALAAKHGVALDGMAFEEKLLALEWPEAPPRSRHMPVGAWRPAADEGAISTFTTSPIPRRSDSLPPLTPPAMARPNPSAPKWKP